MSLFDRLLICLLSIVNASVAIALVWATSAIVSVAARYAAPVERVSAQVEKIAEQASPAVSAVRDLSATIRDFRIWRESQDRRRRTGSPD